jgi:hypothetical protein
MQWWPGFDSVFVPFEPNDEELVSVGDLLGFIVFWFFFSFEIDSDNIVVRLGSLACTGQLDEMIDETAQVFPRSENFSVHMRLHPVHDLDRTPHVILDEANARFRWEFRRHGQREGGRYLWSWLIGDQLGKCEAQRTRLHLQAA